MRDLVLAFRVNGTPVPQGSMRTVGQGVVIHSNAKHLKAWREHVATKAHLAMLPSGDLLLDEPVYVRLEFYLPRPKSVRRLLPHAKPDLDKLTRAVLDALTTARVYVDDSRVVECMASKQYATHEHAAGVVVHIERERDTNE